MTILAVRPGLPQPDIGSLLEALAHHQPVELDCTASTTKVATIEVRSRHDLEEKLAELYPFRPHMSPLEDADRVGVSIMLVHGPPICGRGESVAEEIRDLRENELDYITRWERELRLDIAHQRYWGWVYLLMIFGDDDHIQDRLLAREH